VVPVALALIDTMGGIHVKGRHHVSLEFRQSDATDALVYARARAPFLLVDSTAAHESSFHVAGIFKKLNL